MTKQERIEEMANYIAKCCPDKVDDGCFDKNMNCVSCIAMELYYVLSICKSKDIEVIGNIYDNPELLEEKK